MKGLDGLPLKVCLDPVHGLRKRTKAVHGPGVVCDRVAEADVASSVRSFGSILGGAGSGDLSQLDNYHCHCLGSSPQDKVFMAFAAILIWPIGAVSSSAKASAATNLRAKLNEAFRHARGLQNSFEIFCQKELIVGSVQRVAKACNKVEFLFDPNDELAFDFAFQVCSNLGNSKPRHISHRSYRLAPSSRLTRITFELMREAPPTLSLLSFALQGSFEILNQPS